MLGRISKNPVLKNGFISLMGFGVGGLLGYVFQFFMSRRLSVIEYGEFQSLVALLGLLGFASAALSYFIIAHTSVFAHHQDFEANTQFIRRLKQRLLPAFILVLIFFVGISIPVQHALHTTHVWSVIIIGLAAVLSINTVIYTGLFSGWQNFLAVNVLAVSGTLFKLLTAIVLISLFPSATTATVVLFLSVAGTWALSRFWSNRSFKLNDISVPTTSSWRTKYFANNKTLHQIVFILIFTFLSLFIQNADVLLVKHLATPELAGHYSAFNVLGKLLLWMNLGIISVVLPIAFAQKHSGQTMSYRVRLYAYGLMLIPSFMAIMFYFFVPQFVIRLTVGSAYLIHAPTLWLVGLMNVSLALLLFETNLAFARRDNNALYVLTVAALIFAIGISMSASSILTVATSGLIAFGLTTFGMLFLNIWIPTHPAST